MHDKRHASCPVAKHSEGRRWKVSPSLAGSTKHYFQELQTAYGNISVMKKRTCPLGVIDSQRDDASADVVNEFSIKAMLNHPRFQASVVAKFQQRLFHDGYVAISPSISVGMTLPNNSPLFHIVERGDVRGLKTLLSRGMASLRDRDFDGTPLLHVSRLDGASDLANLFELNSAVLGEAASDVRIFDSEWRRYR